MADRVLTGINDIQAFVVINCSSQFLLDLCLRLTKHVLVNHLAGLRITVYCVATFPAAILTLAYISLTICSAFCHISASFLTANTTPVISRDFCRILCSAAQFLTPYIRISKSSLLLFYCIPRTVFSPFAAFFCSILLLRLLSI